MIKRLTKPKNKDLIIRNNCLKVERAITFFKSNSQFAQNEDINIVIKLKNIKYVLLKFN